MSVSAWVTLLENSGIFCLLITKINFGNYFSNLTKMIAPETEIYEGMFDTIINLTSSKVHVKLWSFMFARESRLPCLCFGVVVLYLQWRYKLSLSAYCMLVSLHHGEVLSHSETDGIYLAPTIHTK